MTGAAGWIVAALVAVVAVLLRCVSAARQKSRNRPSSHSDTAALVRAQNAAIKATEVEIESLWDKLEDDDPTGAITEAANAARDER